MVEFLACVVANAFGRRFAGGLLSQWIGPIGGTQVARGVQAAIAGATILALTGDFPLSGGIALCTFLGATAGFPGPGGMLPAKPWARGVVAHGALAVAPLVAGVVFWAWTTGAPFPLPGVIALACAGAVRPLAYWGAQFWTPHCPGLGLVNLRASGGPIDPPPWAEFLSGGALGAALYTLAWSL